MPLLPLTVTMKTQNHSHALRCLAAADLAPQLSDAIAAIHAQNLAAAKAQTIEQAKTLVNQHVNSLPKFLAVDLTDDDLNRLISQLIY